MPTAQDFNHIGHFPFCPERIDVDDFDAWSTLGGFTKSDADAGGEPTEEQIDNSLKNARKLCWDLHKAFGTAAAQVLVGYVDAEPDGDGSGTAAAQAEDVEHDKEPEERLCDPSTESNSNNEGGEGLMVLADGSSGPITWGVTARIRLDLTPARMYLGGTCVGFGIRSIVTASTAAGSSESVENSGGLELSYRSWVENLNDYDYYKQEAGYATVGGMPCLIYGEIEGGFDGIPASSDNGFEFADIDLANRTVSARWVNATLDLATEMEGTATLEGELEFYTYL